MIGTYEIGGSIKMEYDVVGHDDDTTERVQRSLEAITKDLKHAVFSDGSTLPVGLYDADGDEADLEDAVYLGGGNDEIGYFTILLEPLKHTVFH